MVYHTTSSLSEALKLLKVENVTMQLGDDINNQAEITTEFRDVTNDQRSWWFDKHVNSEAFPIFVIREAVNATSVSLADLIMLLDQQDIELGLAIGRGYKFSPIKFVVESPNNKVILIESTRTEV